MKKFNKKSSKASDGKNKKKWRWITKNKKPKRERAQTPTN
jgi:hypothetical protein